MHMLSLDHIIFRCRVYVVATALVSLPHNRAIMRIIDAIKAVGLIDGVRGYMYTTKARKNRIKLVEKHLRDTKQAYKRDRGFMRISK
jgi:hypothetical protein